ncbi:MAG: protein translocase subunit SecF [Rhodospirillales bacterium]|nr:protein translocase subunit SecF [Rhodospirillales bacterium]
MTKQKVPFSIDFIKLRGLAFLLSALLVMGALAITATRGLNFGIDFSGGTLIEVRLEQTPDLSELRSKLNTLNLGGISIQEFGTAQDLLIRMPEQPGDETAQKAAIDSIQSLLNATYDQKVDYRRVEYVGPQVGEELKLQGLYAILFSLAGIMIYIAFRFEWKFGLAAILALIHDAVATIGLFAVTQMEFNLSTVAAVLMIAGYSINDTVIVFDRIRENLRKFKKMPLGDLLNLSINETLSRTIMTSLTTLLALVSLWFLGGDVIQGFVNALLFGIIVGTYSSIFVAAPILLAIGVERRNETAAATSEVEKVLR